MSFSDLPWHLRKNQMGEEAETKFEETHDGWARTGFNLPPFPMHALPMHLRHLPDYIDKERFIEVQGCGAAGLRLKVEKIRAMTFWDEQYPLWFFIWSTPRHQYAELSFKELLKIIDRGDAKYEQYSENSGKALFRITPSRFEWQDVD